MIACCVSSNAVTTLTPGKAPNRAKGGHKGAKARAASLTPQQRSEIAQAAATAGWKKGD
jgi:hypothetical protein